MTTDLEEQSHAMAEIDQKCWLGLHDLVREKHRQFFRLDKLPEDIQNLLNNWEQAARKLMIAVLSECDNNEEVEWHIEDLRERYKALEILIDTLVPRNPVKPLDQIISESCSIIRTRLQYPPLTKDEKMIRSGPPFGVRTASELAQDDESCLSISRLRERRANQSNPSHQQSL